MMGAQVKLVAWQVTRFFIRKGLLERVVAVLLACKLKLIQANTESCGCYSEHMQLSPKSYIVVQFDLAILKVS
jgi:hypothetical protein